VIYRSITRTIALLEYNRCTHESKITKMSYQVLARKYRPSNFQELKGQEHVLRALVNALDNNRLHHAYLFTGTRGVGKTTIARILAKCLNCEEGVSSVPCGQCSTCIEISEGRSIDLIEYDAASRTKVEDTREILDNVQYMPTRNRFKIYLIDEVHMLSNSSFNALLKTLEEPPEHVKFLLATTDPKKLPITVLSRCLQFNLKNITPELIVNYLDLILKKEAISFDEAALWQLGRAADGSMRDALSLTDQAISFGNNSVNDNDVKTMLGSLDQNEIYSLIQCLIEKDAAGLLQKVQSLASFAPDYSSLLSEFLSVLHRIAVVQAVPDGIDNSQGDKTLVATLANAMSREDVQLFYQIGLIGQRDLPFSPEPRTGFEMVLLRMLAFTPKPTEIRASDASGTASKKKTPEAINNSNTQVKPKIKARTKLRAISSVEKTIPKGDDRNTKNQLEPALKDSTLAEANAFKQNTDISSAVSEKDKSAPVRTEGVSAEGTITKVASNELVVENWANILSQLKLSGVTLSLAKNCVIEHFSEKIWALVLNQHHASLWNKNHEQRMTAALVKHLGKEIEIKVTIGETKAETPAEAEHRLMKQAQVNAVELINNDLNIKQIINKFDGQLEQESIKVR